MKCLVMREWWWFFFCLCYPCSSSLHPSYFPTLIGGRAASVPWWVTLNFNIQDCRSVCVCVPNPKPQPAWRSPGAFKTCSFLKGQVLKLLLFSLHGPARLQCQAQRRGNISLFAQMTKLRCSLSVTADERQSWAGGMSRSFGICSPFGHTPSCSVCSLLVGVRQETPPGTELAHQTPQRRQKDRKWSPGIGLPSFQRNAAWLPADLQAFTS